MKLCCLLFGVAFAIALTTPAECVPHARLARAVPAAPKASAPKAGAPKAGGAAPAATKAPALGVPKLLKNISTSLSSIISPGTGNPNLDNIASTIVNAKMALIDPQGIVLSDFMKQVADDLVTSLAAVSNTSKAAKDKMGPVVQKAAENCTILDCVFDKIGKNEKSLDKSVVGKLKELQKAIDTMNAMVPLDALGSNFGSLLNGFGGANPGKGLGSMLQGMGVPSDVVNGVQNVMKPSNGSAPLSSLFNTLKSPTNGNLDLSQLFGNAGAMGANGGTTGFGAGSVPGDAGFSGLLSNLQGALGGQGANGVPAAGAPANAGFSGMLSNLQGALGGQGAKGTPAAGAAGAGANAGFSGLFGNMFGNMFGGAPTPVKAG